MDEVFVYNFSQKKYSSLSPYKNYKPREIGTFAIIDSGEFAHCNKAIHAKIKEIEVPVNLNEGYDPTIGIQNRHTSVTNFPASEKILRWICSTKDGYDVTSGIDVIAQRGVLKDIGHTLHNSYNNKWTLEACKFDGKIYLRYDDNEEFHADKRHHKNIYWGMEFEKHVLEKVPGVKATFNVITGVIGSINVLISAEIDGEIDTGEHVEVKTTFRKNLCQNLPFHWLQCYLGTVKVLCYGYKDENGFVKEPLVRENMNNIVGNMVSKETANSMFGVIADILSWLKEVIKEGNNVWHLTYDGGGKNGHIEMYNMGYHTEFLPSFYYKFVREIGRKTLEEDEKSLHDDLTEKFNRITLKCESSLDQQKKNAKHTRPDTIYQQCLFLTDSVLSSTPPQIFKRIQGFKVAKKVKKYCKDFFQFEKTFNEYGFVILSIGTNDLHCNGNTAYLLGSSLIPWLKHVCNIYKETVFIFMGVLFYHDSKTNDEIYKFNRLIFDLDEKTLNLRFFDSQSVLQNDPITKQQFLFNILKPAINRSGSVHITLEAATHITEHLVNAVMIEHFKITGQLIPSYLTEWTWPT